MNISWVWYLGAGLSMVTAVALLVLRMRLRLKAVATFLAILLIGMATIFLSLGSSIFDGSSRDPLGTILLVICLFMLFGLGGATANYIRSKDAREWLRNTPENTVPQWIRKINKYLYDVDD